MSMAPAGFGGAPARSAALKLDLYSSSFHDRITSSSDIDFILSC
jgi:hypothetical protein